MRAHTDWSESTGWDVVVLGLMVLIALPIVVVFGVIYGMWWALWTTFDLIAKAVARALT